MARVGTRSAPVDRLPGIPPRARVTEVLPRDGLQSLDRPVPLVGKMRIVDALVRAGLRSIEVTSFARPDLVPNLADADDLLRRLDRVPGVEYRALVPNRRGALRALDAGADALVVLVTVSEAYAAQPESQCPRDRRRGRTDP